MVLGFCDITRVARRKNPVRIVKINAKGVSRFMFYFMLNDESKSCGILVPENMENHGSI